MPIPMGRSGNVDGEGGIPHRILCINTVANSGRPIEVYVCPSLRVWDESSGLQPIRAIRRFRATVALGMAVQSAVLRASALASQPIVEELTNDADDHSTDGS